MNRARFAFGTAVILSLFLQAPLAAQDEDDDDAAEYDFVDTDLEDDSIDVETGTDGIADRVQIIDEDGDPAFDDDEDDPDDDYVFQDDLPLLVDVAEGGEDADGDDEAALDRRLLNHWDLISGGVRVNNMAVGFKVKDGAAPFLVQIRYSIDPHRWRPAARGTLPPVAWAAQHVCGGSLIARDWVITAAHCVHENHIGRGLEISLREEDISSPGQTVKVDRVVYHAGYEDGGSGDMYSDDIALIHLVTPVNIAPVARYTGAIPAPGTPMSTLGWGKTARPEGQFASSDLFRADLKAIAHTICAKVDGYGPQMANGRQVTPIHAGVICGGDSPSKACSGDSGGPLVLTNGLRPMLVGVVSWSRRNSCGQPQYPGVYTRVAAYEEWIRRAMLVTKPGETALR